MKRALLAALFVVSVLSILAPAIGLVRARDSRSRFRLPEPDPRQLLEVSGAGAAGRPMEGHDGDLSVHVLLAGLIVFIAALAYLVTLSVK